MQTQAFQQIESPAISDGVLAQQILAGDQAAFEVLVERYNASLFSFICHILKDYEKAGDVLQQVFLQLYLSLATLYTDRPFKSWLFQVARNRCLDELRRKHPTYFSELEEASDESEIPALVSIPDTSPLPEEIAEQHDLQLRLRRAIDTLPPRFRSVVFLRYSAQLSFAEIGKALNMPEATAKTYFQRAKPLLRALILEDPEGYGR